MAFEYTPYRNPYIGTIADLMARGEDAKAKALIDVASAQARAAEAKGQIYGNAISSIGNQIGNIPAQMQANREQAFKADQQARMVRGQQQEDAAEAQYNQMVGSKNELGSRFVDVPSTPATLASRNMMLNDDGTMGLRDNPSTPATLASRQMVPAVTNPFKELSIRGVDGLDKWDIEKASQQFASQGLGVQGQKYLELMRGSNDDMDKHHASAMTLVQKSAARALQAGSFDMMLGSTNALMDQLANNKVIGREDLSAFQQQIDGLNALPQEQKEPALRGLLRNISGVPEEEYTLNLGDVRMRGGKPIAENPRPLEAPKPYQVTVPGPDGKPMSRLATPEEMKSGVRLYTEPKSSASGGFRFLKGTKGDVIEWPTTQRAPDGYRPYDAVAERQAGVVDGKPSPYALERETRTLNSVDELLSKVNRFTVGYGSLLEKLPESDANAFASELQTLKANIAFNELTAMREASRTGGALGNVSNVELALLESALGALNTRQKPEQMIAQLEKIKASINRWQTARGLQTNAPIVVNPPSDVSMNDAAAALIAKARAKGGR